MCFFFVAPAVGIESQEASKPPPLVVEKGAPLLLDEPSDQGETAASQVIVNNQPCFVCHGNFKTESLAAGHAKQGIGCVDCHGDSFAHRNDENNTTPPETMYPADAIDKACGQCHEAHDVAPAQVVERFLQRWDKKTEPGAIVCTECHGDHRLKVRTVRWNKKTGELVLTDK